MKLGEFSADYTDDYVFSSLSFYLCNSQTTVNTFDAEDHKLAREGVLDEQCGKATEARIDRWRHRKSDRPIDRLFRLQF